MSSDDPFAGLVGCREQVGIADRHVRDPAGQAHFLQDLAERHSSVTLHHVFQCIIGKLHGVEGEAVRLYSSCGPLAGLRGDFRGHIQRLGGQPACGLFLGDVINVGGQVLIRSLRQREGHAHGLAVGWLVFLTRFRVDNFDIKGIGNSDVLIFAAHFLHSGVHLCLLIDRHLFHGQDSIRREHPRPGLDSDHHAVHGHGLVKRRLFCSHSFQHDGEGQRRVRYCKGYVFSGDIALRLGVVSVFTGEQQERAVILRGDGFGIRYFLCGGGIDRHNSGLRI